MRLMNTKIYSPEMILEQLEERIVLDAAVDPVPQDTGDNGIENDGNEDAASISEGPSATDSNTPPPESVEQIFDHDLNVILISNALDQIDALSNAATQDAEVMVYDAADETLSTLVDRLEDLVDTTGEKIGHVAFLSHGDPGILQLGANALVTAGNIESNSRAWQAFSALLAEDARIDLYGCDIGFGQDGVGLVESIANLTGAVVWASEDATGTGSSADWDLEVKSGDSNRPYLLDSGALQHDEIFLDNNNLTNAGFETGDLTGWNVDQVPVTVISVDDRTHGSGTQTYTIEETPFTGDYMIRVDSYQANGDVNQPAQVSQQFTVTDDTDELWFAYNIVSDEYDAGYLDTMGYRVKDSDGQVIAALSDEWFWNDARMLPTGVWIDGYQVHSTGWVEVHLDLTGYQGETLTLALFTGNQNDAQYDSWGYFDFYDPSINKAPRSNGPLDTTVFEDSPDTVINLYERFWDEHPDDRLTFELVSNSNPALVLTPAIGEIADPQNFALSYAADGWGSADITIKVTDPEGVSTEKSFTVTVEPVNDTPTADSSSLTLGKDGSIVFFVTGHDPDLHDPAELDPAEIRFDIVADVQYGTLVATGPVVHDGSGTYTQQYTYTPNPGYNGTDSFQFQFVTPSGSWKGFVTGSGSQIGDAGDSYLTYDMELVDLDGDPDSYPDLVTANWSSDPNMFYINDTVGGFSDGTQVGTDAENSWAIAVGDLDGDGYADAVVQNRNASDLVHIWNPSTGTFDSGTALRNSNSNNYGGIAVGDLDGDGDLDILVGRRSGSDVIYFNPGNGDFSAVDPISITASSPGSTYSVDVADTDGDGDLDIIVGKRGNGTHNLIHLNDGAGNFTSTIQLPRPAGPSEVRTYSIAHGDVDGDGDIDIVAANYGWESTYYRNDGGNTFTAMEIGSDSDNTADVRLADIDRDGDLDILAGNYGQTNKYYLFDASTGTYQAGQDIEDSGSPLWTFGAASGDTDLDGDLDYVAGHNRQNRLFENLGFNDGASGTATVDIRVFSITNPSFEASGGSYEGWTLYAEENWDLDFVATFGIGDQGQTVHRAESVTDYEDGVPAAQYSPSTNGDGFTFAPTEQNHLAFLWQNGPAHMKMYQELTFEADATTLTWDMEYTNHYGEFSADQVLQVYLTDTSDNLLGSVLFITSAGDPAGVSMQQFSADISDFQGQTVRLWIDLNVQIWWFDVILDNFQLEYESVAMASFSAPEPAAPMSLTLAPSFEVSSLSTVEEADLFTTSSMTDMSTLSILESTSQDTTGESDTTAPPSSGSPVPQTVTVETEAPAAADDGTIDSGPVASRGVDGGETDGSTTASSDKMQLAGSDQVPGLPDQELTDSPAVLVASENPKSSALQDTAPSALLFGDQADGANPVVTRQAVVFDLDKVNAFGILAAEPDAPVTGPQIALPGNVQGILESETALLFDLDALSLSALFA